MSYSIEIYGSLSWNSFTFSFMSSWNFPFSFMDSWSFPLFILRAPGKYPFFYYELLDFLLLMSSWIFPFFMSSWIFPFLWAPWCFSFYELLYFFFLCELLFFYSMVIFYFLSIVDTSFYDTDSYTYRPFFPYFFIFSFPCQIFLPWSSEKTTTIYLSSTNCTLFFTKKPMRIKQK